LTANLNQASFRNFDQINFHSSISSHLQPNALISEPLSLLTNVRLLSICDRLKSIEHIDWESLSEFQNLEALIIHEHHRLKTNASRLSQTINEILKNLAENENLAQLKTLVTPVDYQNVKSKDFTTLLSKADLEEVCFFGFARDKRDSDRLRVIVPLEDTSCFNLLSDYSNLTSIELCELPSTCTSYIQSFSKIKNLKNLSLCWIGLFGSWTWKYDFMGFLMNTSNDSKLENLKLMHAGLSLNEDMVSLMPKTLKRIYLSNTNRPDPSFVNAKQLNYGSPLEAHLWGGLFKRCSNLELFIHNSSGSPSVLRLEKSKWSHLKTRIILLRSGEMLKTSNLTDYERRFFININPGLSKYIHKMISLSTPFNF